MVCHTLTDQLITGPGLAGVAERVPAPVGEYATKPGHPQIRKWKRHQRHAKKYGFNFAISILLFLSYRRKLGHSTAIAFLSGMPEVADSGTAIFIQFLSSPENENPQSH